MSSNEMCVLCKAPIEHKYKPMKEWKVNGPICGKCYSKKIFEYYPGDHARVNFNDND